jgi:hypothetical protein
MGRTSSCGPVIKVLIILTKYLLCERYAHEFYVSRSLARLHCALHGGSMEVVVTQGDTIYVSEVESACTRTEESRQNYVKSMRNSSNPLVQQHPLLVVQPQTQLVPAVTTRTTAVNETETETETETEQVRTNVQAARTITSKSDTSNNSANISKGGSNSKNADFFDPLYSPPPVEVAPWNSSVLVLVPLMLGMNTGINSEYIEVRPMYPEKYTFLLN